MATLDDINLFANGGPTDDAMGKKIDEYYAKNNPNSYQNRPMMTPGFFDAEQAVETAKARKILAEELDAGNIKKAYEEGFTQLPIVEQGLGYIFPPTGVPIESYETGYFTDQAGFGMKSPQEFALDVLNPNKNIFQKTPIKAEDPMSGVLAPLSALGALGGIGELANIPKAGLMALRRYQQKTMDGGGGGIGALPPDALEADVKQFAYDPLSGLKSPTIESLIKNAPKNLKGKQITDWLNSKGAPSKGVKPKELPFLNINKFIEENPNATIPDVVEYAGNNQVNIGVTSYKDIGEPGSDFYFETTTPDYDPLDSSYKNNESRVDMVADDPEGYGESLVGLYNSYRTKKYNRTNSEEGIPPKVYEYNEITDEGLAQLDIDRDTLFEDLGDDMYKDNPYELIEPKGTGLVGDTSGTFAFGNDDTGYQFFINNNRMDMTAYGYEDIPYSQAEAEIRLQSIMEQEELIDIGMYGEQQKFKTYVDSTLPGGKNYEEKVYTYDNADDSINRQQFHFDDDKQIAHMLGRDRVLEDGTVSKHADEIQSDLHKKGLRYGYKDPVKDANTEKQMNQGIRESYELHKKVIKTMRDELEEIKALSEKHPELKTYQGEYDYLDKDLAIRQLGAEDFGTLEFKNDADLQTFREHLRTRYGDSQTIKDFGVPNKIQLLEDYVTKRENELNAFTKDKYDIVRDGFSYRPSSEISVMNGTPEEVTTVLKEFRKLDNEPNYAKKINKMDKLRSESTALIGDVTETFLMDLARFVQQYPDAGTASLMTYAKMISEGRANTGGIFKLAYKALRDAELNVLSERASLDLDTLADPRNVDVTNPALARLLDADLSFRETPVTVTKQIINLKDNEKQLRSLSEETTINPERFFETEGNTSEDLKSIRKIDKDITSKMGKLNNAAPDYPFKGDDYAEMVVKNMIMDAIGEGKAAVSVSASPAVVARYSQDEAEFFPRFYDKTIPNMMEKLAKKYGGDFERGQLDLFDTYGDNADQVAARQFRENLAGTMEDLEPEMVKRAKANIIRITPEMRDKILKEGLPQMYMGGKVTKSNSMDRPIEGNRREM